MPRKTKTTKKRSQKRKSMYSIDSMTRTMETGMNMIGNVTVASLGVGLAGAVISKI